jgi:hypothetical protein
MHKPAFVAAPLSDDHGNIGGSLGRDVKVGRVVREITVEVPANPYVTELERSSEATAHLKSRAIGDRWHRRFFGFFLLRFLCDRLRCLYDLACTSK